MTAFAKRVAELLGARAENLERLSGGDLSEVLVFRRPDGRCTVAKGGPAVGTEAAMLRALANAGAPTPAVEGEYETILLLEHVPNDRVFSSNAWANIGAALQRLHQNGGESFGWPVDYALGTVALDNRQRSEWRRFWIEQRLLPTAAVLDRPWRERVERLAPRIAELLPTSPPASLLHGDLWSGNLLVSEGSLTAFIDPACYYGHSEVDLAMLTLFDAPPSAFWDAYGEVDEDAEERRPIYQLFPALVHLRLFGAGYAGLADRILTSLKV